MSKTNESRPSHAMDIAVAAAMGYTIWVANTHPNGWALWTGEPADQLYIRQGEGMREWLPRYSRPYSTYHRAALLDAVLWLNARGVAIIQEDGAWHAGRLDGVWVASVPTACASPAAFALCACRAVLTVAGVEEVADDH